jgi:hypothetical protein
MEIGGDATGQGFFIVSDLSETTGDYVRKHRIFPLWKRSLAS